MYGMGHMGGLGSIDGVYTEYMGRLRAMSNPAPAPNSNPNYNYNPNTDIHTATRAYGLQ